MKFDKNNNNNNKVQSCGCQTFQLSVSHPTRSSADSRCYSFFKLIAKQCLRVIKQHLTSTQSAPLNTHTHALNKTKVCVPGHVIKDRILKTERHVTRVPVTFNSITAISFTCPAVISEPESDIIHKKIQGASWKKICNYSPCPC